MIDIVSPEVRSRMMAGIKSKNTKPELIIRKGLHAAGFRYLLHVRSLPGKPDIVFPKRAAVILVHGCFWHGHNCNLFKWPSSRVDFWRQKIERNRAVDEVARAALVSLDWRYGVVWECALKGRHRLASDVVIQKCAEWLRSDNREIEIRGET